MKLKNKGKVHPSPSSSSSSSCSNAVSASSGGGGVPGGDYLSVLKLLPAAIFTLVAVLPLDDREVLAYLIMRSMKTTITATGVANSSASFSPKKPTKKTASSGGLCCDCFDCYTSFWFRWDSSPNRELIHQAIEAFEDHLTTGETEKNKKNAKSKRRDKMSRRFNANESALRDSTPGRPESAVGTTEEESSSALPGNEAVPVDSPCSAEEKEVDDVDDGSPPCVEEDEVDRTAVSSTATMMHHKGLARKVLPDVLGLFNSRLWSLWSPNV